MEIYVSTKSEHTAGKGLTAGPALTSLQNPSALTRPFQGRSDLETKDL